MIDTMYETPRTKLRIYRSQYYKCVKPFKWRTLNRRMFLYVMVNQLGPEFSRTFYFISKFDHLTNLSNSKMNSNHYYYSSNSYKKQSNGAQLKIHSNVSFILLAINFKFEVGLITNVTFYF